MKKKNHRGLWYWLVLLQPELYFLALLLGDEAAKEAEEAISDIMFVVSVVLLIGLIVGAIYAVLTSFGVF
jgi:hypothetical protein